MLILLKSNYRRVNIFEVKSSKIEINVYVFVCVGARQLFQPSQVSQDTQREAKKRKGEKNRNKKRKEKERKRRSGGKSKLRGKEERRLKKQLKRRK